MSALKVPVLDHGHVILRNLAGPTRRTVDKRVVPMHDGKDAFAYDDREFDADDRDPAQAARMSFDQMDEDRAPEEDFRLSKYLMKNWHTSPFEMIQIWLDMKMPIFCARQFVRHRTARLNEVSGRYITLPEEWYIPEIVGGKALNAKQGQSDNLDPEIAATFKRALDKSCREDYGDYLWAIENGVAAEHARLLLHVNHYTHWLWNQDFHNMMGFLRLRDHFHAQIEAQQYAKGIDGLIRKFLPKSMELYDEFRRMKVKTQAGWLLKGPPRNGVSEDELVPFQPHVPPLTTSDEANGWTAIPLFMEE